MALRDIKLRGDKRPLALLDGLNMDTITKKHKQTSAVTR